MWFERVEEEIQPYRLYTNDNHYISFSVLNNKIYTIMKSKKKIVNKSLKTLNKHNLKRWTWEQTHQSKDAFGPIFCPSKTIQCENKSTHIYIYVCMYYQTRSIAPINKHDLLRIKKKKKRLFIWFTETKMKYPLIISHRSEAWNPPHITMWMHFFPAIWHKHIVPSTESGLQITPDRNIPRQNSRMLNSFKYHSNPDDEVHSL